MGRRHLALLAVHVEPHLEILRVLDFVTGDEPRPDRPEGLAAFAFIPLSARAVDLKATLRHVIRQEIARDRAHRLASVEIACALADHDAEFDLVV